MLGVDTGPHRPAQQVLADPSVADLAQARTLIWLALGLCMQQATTRCLHPLVACSAAAALRVTQAARAAAPWPSAAVGLAAARVQGDG